MEKELTKISEKMYKALSADFPDEAYSVHSSKTYLTVLKAMYITERLNEVFGVGRWCIKTEVAERSDDYVLVVGEFVSLDYDVMVTPQYGGHKTTGKGTEIADGFKSAVTDCQSKIASYLGVGINMFKGKVKAKGCTNKKDNYKSEAVDGMEYDSYGTPIYNEKFHVKKVMVGGDFKGNCALCKKEGGGYSSQIKSFFVTKPKEKEGADMPFDPEYEDLPFGAN